MYEKQHGWLQIYHSPQWNVERMIWIGYNKNNDNQQCFLPSLPKDVIRSILDFLNQTVVCEYPQVDQSQETDSNKNEKDENDNKDTL